MSRVFEVTANEPSPRCNCLGSGTSFISCALAKADTRPNRSSASAALPDRSRRMPAPNTTRQRPARKQGRLLGRREIENRPQIGNGAFGNVLVLNLECRDGSLE